MLHPLKKRIGDGLWIFAVSLLLSFSLSLLWVHTFVAVGQMLPVLLRCAAFCFAFGLLTVLPGEKWKWFFLFALAAASAVLCLYHLGPVYEIIQGARAMIIQWTHRGEGGNVMYALNYSGDLMNGVCFLFCFFMYMMAEGDAFLSCVFFYVVFAAVPFVMALSPADQAPVYSFEASEGLRMCAPGLAGLVMLFGAKGGRRVSLLPIALLLTLGAMLLCPAEGTVNNDLNRLAEKTAWMTRDLVYTGESRNAFTLASSGQMPLEDRLGGSARLTSSPVVQVSTSWKGPVYLKAASSDTYTGSGWQDTLSDRGYLYNGLGTARAKKEIYGNTKIEGAAPVTLTVRMLRDDTSTILSPQRFISFEGGSDRMVLYFNRSGELYLTRDLAAGEVYTITALMPDEKDAAAYIASVSDPEDPIWEEMLEKYLNVPSCVSSQVWTMTENALRGIMDPLDRALALKKYLVNTYPYNLETGTPQADEDFVSWFLLEEQQGYCTYFASAMTIMCRMAGIPARYAVGYAFVPSGDGVDTVYSGMGHAWTEIYLKGFGWLTIDATGSSQMADYILEHENSGSDEATGSDGSFTVQDQASGVPDDPAANSPSPEKSPAVILTPTPLHTENTTDVPHGNTRAPESDNINEKGNTGSDSGWILWMFLILICVIICFTAVRYRITRPESRAEKNKESAASVYYNEAFNICAVRFGEIMPSETWPDYAERICRDENIKDLKAAAQDMEAKIYARDHVCNESLAQALYTDLWNGCTRRQKIKVILGRIFHIA